MFILDCDEIKQMCYNVQPILYVVKYIINVLQWTVPLILIVLGTWDMVKAVTKAEDEKAISEARSNLIKRIIYGVVIFLVPFFVSFILGLIESNINLEDDNLPTAWIECWNNANDIKNSYFDGCTDIFEPTEDERYHEAPVVKGECRDASGNLKATSVTEKDCKDIVGEGYQFTTLNGNNQVDGGNSVSRTCLVSNTEYDQNTSKCIRTYYISESLLKRENQNQTMEKWAEIYNDGSTDTSKNFFKRACKDYLGTDPIDVTFSDGVTTGSNGNQITLYYFTCIYNSN